jgi:tetratricopeptide (TPR) repeat protein
MKKVSILVMAMFVVTGTFAQDCALNENAKRYWFRANAAVKSATKAADYKLAVSEYLTAQKYAPECSDIHYNLGLCYEKMGELDAQNFQKAIAQFKTYLQMRPAAKNKDEVQEKIYELEFMAEK